VPSADKARTEGERSPVEIKILSTNFDKHNVDNEFLDKLWMLVEAHFHLTVYVNKQNHRSWADSSPKEVNERPLHSRKVTVWCAVSSHGVIGPYIFENEERITMTVTSDRYVEMLQSFVAPAVINFPQLHGAWFQQDGATSQAARQAMAAVRELFGYRVISRFGDIPCPPISPDLSVCDFFLWGYLKNRLYTPRPRTMMN